MHETGSANSARSARGGAGPVSRPRPNAGGAAPPCTPRGRRPLPAVAALLCGLFLVSIFAGCLDRDLADGPQPPSPFTGVLFEPRAGSTTCDTPLLAEGDRTRSSEVMVATNPLDHDELAAVFKVAYPFGEQGTSADPPMWDALARSTDAGRTWTYRILHGYPGDPEFHVPSAVLYGSIFLSDPVVAFA